MTNNLYCDQCKTELDFTIDDAKDEHMLHFDTLDELPVAYFCYKCIVRIMMESVTGEQNESY